MKLDIPDEFMDGSIAFEFQTALHAIWKRSPPWKNRNPFESPRTIDNNIFYYAVSKPEAAASITFNSGNYFGVW